MMSKNQIINNMLTLKSQVSKRKKAQEKNHPLPSG